MKKIVALLMLFTIQLHANENTTSTHFKNIKHDPIQLREFLYNFPKGGDIHTHIDGAVYAENMVKWASEDGKCIDLTTYKIMLPPCDTKDNKPKVSSIISDATIVNRLIDAFSIRNYQQYNVSGSEQFFSTFDRIHNTSIGREGDMLSEVAQRAARQNTFYLEVMESWNMGAARDFANSEDFNSIDKRQKAITTIAHQTIAMIDKAEKRRNSLQNCSNSNSPNKLACQVKIAYIPQVIRIFSRNQVQAQTLLAIKLVELDPRFVGFTFVAPENADVTIRDYTWQMQMIKAATANKSINLSLHAGEITHDQVTSQQFHQQLGTHVRQAIETAGANRIGHGIDIIYDKNRKQLLKYMADEKIAVEINLTTNDIILEIKGNEHPFNLYRKTGVPLTLSTDDEGIARIDLTHEYQRAVETYELSYADIKEFSRNALIYSFQSGKSLLDSNHDYIGHCKNLTKQKKTKACAKFITQSRKAQLQYELEQRFRVFEKNFK